MVPCRKANDWIDSRWRGKADGRSPVCNSDGHVLKDGAWWHRADTDDVLSSSQQDPVPAPNLTGASGRAFTVGGYIIEEAQVPRGYLWFVGGSFLLNPMDMTRAIDEFNRGSSTMTVYASHLTRSVIKISDRWKATGCKVEFAAFESLP